MTALLQKAFQEAQKLPLELQDKIAQQLLDDIRNELQWQAELSNPDTDISPLLEMAQAALLEDDAGATEDLGFGDMG